MKKIMIMLLICASIICAQIKPYRSLQPYQTMETSISMGLIGGAFVVDKFGEVDNVEIGVPSTIWEHGGEYIYDADSTAPIKYLVSSSLLDVGQTINVQGLDSLGFLVSQDITTNGQTNVLLKTPLWRAYRMENISPKDGGELSGMVHVHTSASAPSGVPPDANIRAGINNGNNQTLMALYTCAAGKVCFLWRGEIGMGLTGNNQTTSEFCVVEYMSRRYGKLFRVKKRLTISNNGTSNYQDYRSFPDPIPALTDVQIHVKEVSTESRLWATMDFLVLDEEHFTEEYLQKIGQPGY